MSNEYLLFFSKFIEKELGIIYSENNFYQLESRLEELSKTLNLGSVLELYQKAQKDGIQGDFRKKILDIATNNETLFFRDQKVFQNIEKIILPKIVSSLQEGEGVRIWSAASSYGQEPYSIAMLLNEMNEKKQCPSFEVFATDISERVLERAQKGVFSHLEVQRGLPINYLKKYFKKDDENNWNIHPDIRKKVFFQKQNLKEPIALNGSFHLILCRNVLLYQNLENKSIIINRISRYLKSGGYLILGAGESLMGIDNPLKQLLFEGLVIYQLP